MTQDGARSDEGRLDHALASLFAENEEDRFPEGVQGHVEVDRLAAFRAGELDEDQQKAIRSHLIDCRECSALWRDLAALEPESASHAVADFRIASAWQDLQTRLGSESETEQARPQRWTWAQLAAAVLFVTSLILVYQVRQLGQTASEMQARMAILEAPRENVPVLYLDALRSTSDETSLPEGPADEIVVLMISPSIRDAFPSYELVIEDARGQVVWSGQGFEQNAYGTIRMAARRSLFSAGVSTVRLFGVRQEVREPAGVYLLTSP